MTSALTPTTSISLVNVENASLMSSVLSIDPGSFNSLNFSLNSEQKQKATTESGAASAAQHSDVEMNENGSAVVEKGSEIAQDVKSRETEQSQASNVNEKNENDEIEHVVDVGHALVPFSARQVVFETRSRAPFFPDPDQFEGGSSSTKVSVFIDLSRFKYSSKAKDTPPNNLKKLKSEMLVKSGKIKEKIGKVASFSPSSPLVGLKIHGVGQREMQGRDKIYVKYVMQTGKEESAERAAVLSIPTNLPVLSLRFLNRVTQLTIHIDSSPFSPIRSSPLASPS